MSYAALDILIPLHTPNLKLLKRCLAGIDRSPPGCIYRVVLLLDGMSRSEREKVAAMMKERDPQRTPNPIGQPGVHQLNAEPPKQTPDWLIVDWPGVVYWKDSVMNGIPRVQAEWLMILPPWIELDCKRWFGLLQQPFMQAPHTMLVCPSLPEAPRNTMAPMQFLPRKHPESEFGLMRSKAAQPILPKISFDSPQSMMKAYSEASEERAGLRWLAPSVRYHSIEHKPHKSCRESSKSQEKGSESPSPTTPASSTPTTTVRDGFGGSMPF